MFAGRPLAIEELTGYYQASLVYSDLYGQIQLRKTYEEGVLRATVEKYCKLAFNIPDKTVDQKVVEWTAWTVPVPFCCM